MKKTALLWVMLVLVCLLSACSLREESGESLTVVVESGEHYSLEVPLVSVPSGGSAAFYIQTDPGYAVTETDYRGDYSLTQTRGLTKLVLENVVYPTRVRLSLSHSIRSIRYEANGGEALTGAGKSITASYDVSVHIRPNVSIGTDLFAREGHTLTGWNTEPDGSGTSVGLGSRMSVEDTAVLYAQWAKWTDAACFSYKLADGGAIVTGYSGAETVLVLPEALGGCPVTQIADRAFAGCTAETVILPKSLLRVEKNAFEGAALRELHFFDNIEYITDDCFAGCEQFSTLCISAIEDPYGYSFRRESVWADKLDLLIETMGQERLIFYGGCSMWYNFMGGEAQAWLGEDRRVLNMGLNGVSSSLLQMELLRCFVTGRDILIHAPEISSRQQLLLYTALSKNDDKLWCALEYDYDLVSLLDIRVFDGGVLESLRLYLDKKQPGGSYTDVYHDSKGYLFNDPSGSIPFVRTESAESLVDSVELDPVYLEDLSRLEEEYEYFTEMGIPIYVGCACVNIQRVPEEQQGNVELMDGLYRERFSAMEGVTVISRQQDYLFCDADCYDTVYHLLTPGAERYTRTLLRDLSAVLEENG